MSATPHQGPDWRGVILPFATVTLIWSSTWIVIRDQLGVVPPSWSVCYRFLIASVGMAIVARLAGAKLWIGWRGIAFAALIGFMQFSMNFNFVYRAEAHITSGLVALVFALLIIPNTLLSWLWFKARVTPRFLAGSAVACAGVALLFIHEYRAAPVGGSAVLAGVGLTLMGTLCASIANAMQNARIAHEQPVTSLLAWAMLLGALCDGAFAWVTSGPPVSDPRLGYWLGTVYLALAGSVITFPLYYKLIRRIGAGRAAYSSLLIPIIAMAISTVVEDYRWSLMSAAGAVLSLAGMALAMRSKQGS
jgi:drug/metabolite transporter (DMT)-like permease